MRFFLGKNAATHQLGQDGRRSGNLCFPSELGGDIQNGQVSAQAQADKKALTAIVGEAQEQGKQRRPTIPGFIKAVNKSGLDSPDAQGMLSRMTYRQLGELVDTPDFQTCLKAYVAHALLSDKPLSPSARWAISFLSGKETRTNRAPTETADWDRGSGHQKAGIKVEPE